MSCSRLLEIACRTYSKADASGKHGEGEHDRGGAWLGGLMTLKYRYVFA
jgi:hypothetical protein